MPERAFYDTVIFALSLNTGDPDHEGCRWLLDVDGAHIFWAIALSVISRGEASMGEYLDQLEQRCAAQGIEWHEVPQSEISSALRQRPALKTRLSQAGMQTRDIKQVFAAWCLLGLMKSRARKSLKRHASNV